MTNNKNRKLGWYVALCVILTVAASAMGQTISPPIAEYRGKAQGMVELRNDGDQPLATIVEVYGFTVDENGILKYVELDKSVKVNVGSSSFVIPPHQSQFVFYKVRSEEPYCWFAILSTLANANPAPGKMRINYVLPHIVYVYQKSKLKKNDVSAKFTPTERPGEFRLEIQNNSGKLGRVETIEGHGFGKEMMLGGVPLFPTGKRYVTFTADKIAGNASLKLNFEDGFSVAVPVI